MSFDLAVWYPHRKLSSAEADELLGRVSEGEMALLEPHPAIDHFYLELTSIHPELGSVASNGLGGSDECPWAGPLERSRGHVLMNCVWSQADRVAPLVRELAAKHGLAVYDPQESRITWPPGAFDRRASRRPWWQFW